MEEDGDSETTDAEPDILITLKDVEIPPRLVARQTQALLGGSKCPLYVCPQIRQSRTRLDTARAAQ